MKTLFVMMGLFIILSLFIRRYSVKTRFLMLAVISILILYTTFS
jgi:hypothetical protein